MPATVHVIARIRAKEGKEEALKNVLSALVAPSRRELACYYYDLLQNIRDPRDFTFIERWESEKGLDEHAASAHVKKVAEQLDGLVEGPPEIHRYQPV
jgi:quinol monooxygenase YgiN